VSEYSSFVVEKMFRILAQPHHLADLTEQMLHQEGVRIFQHDGMVSNSY